MGGGSAWAKATFGKGLKAGSEWETCVGGSICDFGDATGTGWCVLIIGATAGVGGWACFPELWVDLFLKPNRQFGGWDWELFLGAGATFAAVGEPTLGGGTPFLGVDEGIGVGVCAWVCAWVCACLCVGVGVGVGAGAGGAGTCVDEGKGEISGERWASWWWWWWCRCWWWWWCGGCARGAGEGDHAEPPPSFPWRECCKTDESWTCLTLPNSVWFKPRLCGPMMVCASCFSLSSEGVIPTASRTVDWTRVGASTVEPSEFDKLMYKFCNHRENPIKISMGHSMTSISSFKNLQQVLRIVNCIYA